MSEMPFVNAEILICNLLRAALMRAPLNMELFRNSGREIWEEVFRLSYPHHITAILYEAIVSLPKEFEPPRDLLLKFGVVADIVEEEYRRKESMMADLSRVFNENDLDVMLLKGMGISRYYPVPNHRGSSDIDIYLYGQEEKGDRLLEQKWGIVVSDDVHHHTTCEIGGILIENHYDFVNTHDHKSSKEIERVLKHLAALPCKTLLIGGYPVRVPSAQFNALFLMRHMAAHYAAERISIRHLCDWMMFLTAEYRNIDFDEIHGYYKKFNIYTFATAVYGILIDRFGMDETLLPAFERDRELETRIFNDILYPRFNRKRPSKGTLKILDWKIRRFFANRWKHRIVYSEPWWITFFQSGFSHLMKPKTIKH